MTTLDSSAPTTTRVTTKPNGEAVAAFLAGGIGALGLGLLVLIKEAGLWEAPNPSEAVGGLSGRSTVALVIWVVAWVALHLALRGKTVDGRLAAIGTFGAVGLGLLFAYPPFWAVL